MKPGSIWWDDNEKVVTHSRIPTGSVSNPLDPTLRTPYWERETVYLQGVNFTPNSYLPLSLYKGAFDLQFVRAFTVNTDAEGRFETTLKIDPEFEDGFYSVIPSEMFDSPDSNTPISGAFATFEVLNQLPYGEHDVSVAWVVTEAGIFHPAPAEGRYRGTAQASA